MYFWRGNPPVSARAQLAVRDGCLGRPLETQPDVTVACLDGRSAYDTVFLSKLHQVATTLLPFVRCLGAAVGILLVDAAGLCCGICQAGGCERVDALAPAWFSIGRHDDLARAADRG